MADPLPQDPTASTRRSGREPSDPEAETDDLELMLRIRGGDRAAFAELVDRYWAPLVLYGDGFLLDRDAAYDMAQEAFVRLWRRRKQWQVGGSVRLWLFRTVRNLCLSQQRKKEVRSRWATMEGALRRPSASPLRELENAELRAAIETALESLSPRRREAFTLFHLRDFSYAEVAEVMEVRQQTVANYLQAALAELRVALKKHFPGLRETGRTQGPGGQDSRSDDAFDE